MAALILADSDGSGGGDSARQALLPVAGQTLIEYQARSAHAAGALHVVVMVDQLPGTLAAAFDRLRAEGLAIDVARNVRDAADRVHPDEDLLVFASGVVADRSTAAEFASRQAPAVLTVPDILATVHYERIDGSDRWAGLALLKGEHLRRTAAMIGDWSLAPTLLRVAVQRQAMRVPLAHGFSVAMIRDEAQAKSISSRLARIEGGDGGSPFAIMTNAIASVAAAAVIVRPLPFDLVQIVAPILFAVAALLAWLELPAIGFAVFLIGAIAGAAAQRYAVAAMRSSPLLRWRNEIELAALAVLLLFMAGLAWRDGMGWGVNVLAIWIIANCALIPRSMRWTPAPGDQATILLLASALDWQVAGLVLCVAWQLAAAAVRRRTALVAP